MGEVLLSSYARAPQKVLELICELLPKVILSLGYSTRIPRIRGETRGYNLKDSQYSDCDGIQYLGVVAGPGGPEFVPTNANNPKIWRLSSKLVWTQSSRITQRGSSATTLSTRLPGRSVDAASTSPSPTSTRQHPRPFPI